MKLPFTINSLAHDLGSKSSVAATHSHGRRHGLLFFGPPGLKRIGATCGRSVFVVRRLFTDAWCENELWSFDWP